MSALKGGPAAMAAVGCTALVLVATAVTGGSVDEEDSLPGGDAVGLNVDAIPAEYRDWVIQAGKLCADALTALIAAQIEAESNWNPRAGSHAGAQGIAQFIPSTWATWGVDADSDGDADVWSPPDAIMTQARYDCYLADEVRRYKILGVENRQLMLAAYNAGPFAVAQAGGIPINGETEIYVPKIIQLMQKYSAALDETSGPFGARVIASAKRWLGTPYSWGGGSISGPTYGVAQGSGTKGFDCSSLVQYAVYHASGGKILLPRTSQVQVGEGKAIARKDLRPGDVIGFQLSGSAAGYDHIGIYVGGGQFIHAPRTGQTVSYARLTDGYYASKPQTIRRYG